MNNENQKADAVDVIDICDLEYDVAGVGAEEASSSEDNHAAFYLISYRLPENGA